MNDEARAASEALPSLIYHGPSIGPDAFNSTRRWLAADALFAQNADRSVPAVLIVDASMLSEEIQGGLRGSRGPLFFCDGACCLRGDRGAARTRARTPRGSRDTAPA